MQKKIIALAVAGLVSGAAFAQSNVTVYGVADMAYTYGSGDGVKSTHFVNSGQLSGSRLGFRGTEDLGNGLKALFTLEYGLAMDADTGVGAGTAIGRQQFVGLTGNFGTAIAGRLQTAGYDWACANSPMPGSAFDANHKLGVGTLLACANSARANNAVAYVSPSFGGLKFAVNHGRVTENEFADANAQDDSYANLLSATYAVGPMAASLVYSKINANHAAVSATVNDVKEMGLGGSYDFGVVKLFGSYQTAKLGTSFGTTDTSRNNKWQLAAGIPVGPAGTVVLQYADNSIKNTAASDDSKSFSLGYLHAMSKRTTAYAGYNRVSNDGVATRQSVAGSLSAVSYSTTAGPTNTTAAGTSSFTPGGDSSSLTVGLRHSF